jgi:hypothetical protein
MTTGQSIVNKTVFQLNYTAPIQLSNIKDTLTSTTSIFANGATYYVQASNDGVNWVNVSSLQTAGASASGNVLNFPSNATTGYSSYRIYGQSGTTSTGTTREFVPTFTKPYVASANPKVSCSTDTDGDGITNDKDLDSDGDGCPDAKEAGVVGTLNSGNIQNNVSGVLTTTSGVANTIANGPYGANGFADGIQATADTNTYVNTYTYQYATSSFINACMDTDGDGIPDIVDIDDDNDGILDAIEAPSCYYTLNELDSIITISTGLNIATGNIGLAKDGILTNTFSFTNAQVLANDTLFAFTLSTYEELDTVSINLSGTTGIGTASPAKATLQAWNGSSWINLSDSINLNGTFSSGYIHFPITLNKGKYDSYRILGKSGTINTTTINELEVSLLTYTSTSSYPRLSCSTDTDGDGITNDKDLDSDGDGCPDAKEAGVVGTLNSGNIQR